MFKKMEYVYAVYKEKSFSRAAQNLFISQPSLSAAVKRIEKKIGIPIFDRSTTPVRLTECGEAYIKAVENIMYVEQNFKQYLDDYASLETGTLSVGSSNFFTTFILPDILLEFSTRYPGIQLDIIEGNTDILEQKLAAGTLDILIDVNDFGEDLYTQYLYGQEHLLLTVPASYPENQSLKQYSLTSQDIREGRHLDETVPGVPLEQFREKSFLLMRPGNDTRERSEKLCKNHGFRPRILLNVDQQFTAYNLCNHGMGLTFVSDSLVKNVQPSSSLIYYRLDDTDAKRDIYFYCKQNRYITPALKNFIHMIATEEPDE